MNSKAFTNAFGFNGIDLSYRRSGTNWPKKWRVRLSTNKNERDEFRATEYGDSPAEAIQALMAITPPPIILRHEKDLLALIKDVSL